ncbi:hypothetical protein ACSFE6_04265 [Pseudomonas baetica]|uniref:hypothetical protein n=1 Tax=Pseudomonas baetica TaxID=674054 RepID=UPI003EEE5CFE
MDFELSKEISQATVAPIVDAIKRADEGDLIRVHLKSNMGGEVPAACALVLAIRGTKANVEILIDRHIMSAAAFIWIWFAIRTQDNVKALHPDQPSVVMYHRPRQMNLASPSHFLFRDELEEGHPLKAIMLMSEQMFDELFEELLQALGYTPEVEESLKHDGADYWHHLVHLKRAYYQNRDCVLTF